MPAKTPAPPYQAMIFSAKISAATRPLFEKLLDYVNETAPKAEGFLGIEEARGETDWIVVIYWKDESLLQAYGRELREFGGKHPTLAMAVLTAKTRFAEVSRCLP